jgi:nucleotide-binding universal stress UspA family protein
MTIKTILVLMNAARSDRGTLDLALLVAKPRQAHVRVVFVRPDPRDVALYSGFGAEGIGLGSLMTQMEKEGADASGRARKLFEDWCANNEIPETAPDSARVSASWRDEIGSVDQVVPQIGGLADLIVETGLHDRDLPLEQTTIEASLFGAGRPILVAPKTVPAGLGETAMIAWNGSREANRAVGAALELLAACKKVLIFCEPEGSRRAADPADLVAFLGAHGIAAYHVPTAKSGVSVGANLLTLCERECASLLVMGAYTHGRFREMVLGGVTDHVLRHAGMPVLLAH